jgi:coenzyme F420-reducing hydrogenase beta subunit
MTEQRKSLGYFIGHVNNAEHRYKASSGGLGTMLQKYLLSTGQYGTSITFQFNTDRCMYEIKLIHTAEEVNICGSIYQDINIAQFIHNHIAEITNGIIVSCPPCQVSVIRNMLNREGIPCFIISFCCSGQTTIEGTWKYYELLGIKKEDVINMQYRGNGWPSGIQIWLKNNTKIFRDNYTEPWKTIHASWLYRPKRCFFCTYGTSQTADISLADPWLINFIANDTIGNTLFIVNTDKGERIIHNLKEANLIDFSQSDYNSYYYAQQPNIEKNNRIRNQQKLIYTLLWLTQKQCIRNYFSKSWHRMKQFIKLSYYIQFKALTTRKKA